MFYYIPQDYGVRYIVPFRDVDGNDWEVRIAQPNYDSSTVTLLGCEFPVEWEGRGDDSQDEVLLGSTGTLRLVCRNATERDTVFVNGGLLPSVINDCRVQVFRFMNNNWEIYWQGFIQPQTFSQDWDSTPYEVELPIISTVAALEYFPMPSPVPSGVGGNCYDYFMEQSTIGGLLRAIFIWTGCEFLNIITNKPNYQDFNGDIINDGLSTQHWTEGIVSPAYFYDNQAGRITPQTFADVIETLCYPWGKVQEYNVDVAVLLRWKNDVADGAQLHCLPIWNNYNAATYATGSRFSSYNPIFSIGISNIKTAGTDNTHSIIQPPSKIKFTTNNQSSNEIFSFSENSIKPSFTVGNTFPSPNVTRDFNGVDRFVFPLNKDDVDMSFAEDWEITSDQPDYPFCRAVEVTANNTDHTFSVSRTIPFGLCFSINSDASALQPKSVSTYFTIPQGVRTMVGVNNIKITLKPYVLTHQEPSQMNPTTPLNYTKMMVVIQDLDNLDNNNNGKYLQRNDDDLDWVSGSSENPPTAYPFNVNNGEFTLQFCEERANNDNLVHKLRIGIICETDHILQNINYARMYCDIKLEYADENRMVNVGDNTWEYSDEAVRAELAKGINDKSDIAGEGSGDEELEIELKTRAGNRNIVTNDNVRMPENSFNDYTGYADTGDREQIEIDSAQFERYEIGVDVLDFATSYLVVTDGSKVFIPVAVGMNPKMNTLYLRLVSTNVTTEQPTPVFPYDAEIEYLSSNSQAYIDTGISGGNDNLEISCEFEYTTFVSYGGIYGNYVSNDNNAYRLILGSGTGSGIICNNTKCNTPGNTDILILPNVSYLIKSNQSTITINDSTTSITKTGTGTVNNGKIAIFNRSVTNPNTTRNIGLKIKSFSIKDNGTLVRDFIPVRVGEVGYMYDRVSGNLFGNDGTGEFVIGPDKN